ncbi:MAG: beta-ketoacyl-[acyl-carrier-protein] synthase family protein [Planctomycetes bacterium]|nr:beta-ketoacyl-[acyl-carrier-protein] synthase family protein [Planctomycetota bacterium]
MTRRRVVITGMGCVTPLGHDVESTWSALLAGKSGISKTELFDAETFPSTFSAQVKNFQLPEPLAKSGVHDLAGRQAKFALAAALEAWTQSGLDKSDQYNPDRTGIYLGAGEGSLDFDNFTSLLIDAWNNGKLDTCKWAKLAYERFEIHREQEQEANMVLSHLANQFGIEGPAINILTACAASTQAIGEATMIIRRGDADVMMTGGAHSMIHPYGVTGFNRLNALSTKNDEITTASRPFDLTRDGFVLGEGAGILILEDYEHAKNRGANILAEILGYGSSADAFRITDQDPNGEGAAAGMKAALEDANLKPEQIDYISAHGTSTPQNDTVETKAIKAVFGEFAYKVPISSIKSSLGHLIAAAGVVEAISCVLAIRDQILPATMNLKIPDPQCDLDYIPNEPRKATVRVTMSNSFGFGGQNNTIIIGKI